MINKLKNYIVDYYTSVDTAAMIALSVVVIWFNTVAGVICLVATAGIWAYQKYVGSKNIEKKLNAYKGEIIKERGDLMDTFSSGSPLLLCVTNRDGAIQWSNPAFEALFETQADFDEKVGKDFVEKFYQNSDSIEDVAVGEKVFSVTSADMSGNNEGFRMFFWRNVTAREILKKRFRDAMLCFAYIDVDNYDDIMEASDPQNRSSVTAEIDQVVYKYAGGDSAAVCKVKDSRYVVLFQQKQLESMKAKGFEVLNAVHEVKTQADFPTSLSIGIGTGDYELDELQSSAAEALELAIGRGGDQAVIRVRGGETEYFGGALPTVEKRNKGKSRVMAHALEKLIQDADKVYVMGHARPDMDSFGSGLGVYAFANNLGRPVYYVLSGSSDGIEEIYKAAQELNSYEFIDPQKAEEAITAKTLLVLVDHHRAALAEDPKLIELASKIVVIDHHRKSADAIENPLLSDMESYASSASELVSEILQYSGDKGEINKFEAEALLAGITLDTKNFTMNTGVRTFEAASWLRRNGADNGNIKNYFKVDLSFYQKKVNIIANAEILENGFAVAYTKDRDPAMSVIVSQAADELLKMKGVEAAVAAGYGPGATMVSARSNGKYNVQVLMEKLGGGGHQLAAAVQMELSPEEAISQVVQAMRLEGIL